MVEGERQNRIYWLGGSKGGVGKSMMTMALLDHLLGLEKSVVLVECDTSNPDVAKAYGTHDNVKAELVNLDEGDGWIHLVNLCEQHRGTPIVINSAARNNLAVKQYAQTLDRSLEELQRQLIVLWIINRQRDSLELLKEFLDAVPKAAVHVVRNGYFGDEKKFQLYNISKVRALIEERGGRSVTLPDLADVVADDIYLHRMSLTEAAKRLPIGSRAELGRWRGEVGKVITEVLA